jgi:hypothetical protein
MYHLHPFDDLHRIHRPAALAASSSSEAFRANLKTLTRPLVDYAAKALTEAQEAKVVALRARGYSDADIQTVQTLGLLT